MFDHNAIRHPSTFLASSQNPDGGWGYAPEMVSVVEATAAVVLAFGGDPGCAEACRRGLEWLAGGQHADGGWGYSLDDPESTWHTSWAVWALARSNRLSGEARPRALEWLSRINVFLTADDEMQRDISAANGVDITIPGWAWLPGEVTWVEPTAFAMLALQASRPLPPAAQARLETGVRCLVSRRCPGGGWNVGVPVMLGAAMPPRAVPTALCVLALAQVARANVLPGDLATLKREMTLDGGLLGLGWGLVALNAVGDGDAEAARLLAGQQRADGSWDANPYATALAWMALNDADGLT